MVIMERQSAAETLLSASYCLRLGSELIKGLKIRLSSIIAAFYKDILG